MGQGKRRKGLVMLWLKICVIDKLLFLFSFLCSSF